MKSTNSNQPALAPSFSYSSIVSSPSSSSTPPQSPTATATKSSKTLSNNIKWSVTRSGVAFFYGGVVLSIFFVAIWSNEQLPFPAISSSATCSENNESDSCSTSIDSDEDVQYRGKVIGANVKAADLAAAYQSIKSEYAALALHPSTSTNNNWQLLSSHKDGSEVSLLEHPTDPACPYVRMTSIMPGTVQDVWDFLDLSNWETSMPKMDPFYEGLTVMGDYKHRGIEMKLARKTIKRLVAFGKRDFTFVSVSDHLGGDTDAWVSGTVSVVTDQIPREEGYVRAYQDSIAFYERMGNDEETDKPRMKLTIVFRIDLNDSRDGGNGGYVPMWIYVKTIGTTGMASVQNMKRQLELIAKGKEDNDDIESCDKNWLTRIRNGTKKC